ncbi:MAG: hypothetical protein AAF787_16720, partial [Chloroflexota bacterium]
MSMLERHQKLAKLRDAINLVEEIYQQTGAPHLLATANSLRNAIENQKAENIEAEIADYANAYKMISNGDRVVFWLEDRLRENKQDDTLFD